MGYYPYCLIRKNNSVESGTLRTSKKKRKEDIKKQLEPSKKISLDFSVFINA